MPWGAIAQGATDVASSALGAIFAQKSAKKQYSRAVSAYQQRYQWTMADMRKAGLNPILAAGQGAGSAPSASMPAASGKTSDYAGSISKSSRLKSEVALLNAQQDNVAASTAETAARTATIVQTREAIVKKARADADYQTYGLTKARNDADFYATPQGRAFLKVQRAREAAGLPGAIGQAASSAWGFLTRDRK